MKKHTPFLTNGAQKLCCGCGGPFPIRHDRSEALVGLDGQLYCYAAKLECAELAMNPVALRQAG